jgi:ABC-type multidrug transport system ATPase subunit
LNHNEVFSKEKSSHKNLVLDLYPDPDLKKSGCAKLTRSIMCRDEMSQNLSGGMQRKLSIACAFVGGSKYVKLSFILTIINYY